MANWKKLAQGAAGAAGGGAGLNVEEVFSTYLYEGNSTDNTTITNNIDLSTEGGMVWIKRRDSSGDHSVFDTERGIEKRLITNATSAEFDLTSVNISGLSAFNTDGFDLGRWTTVNENTDEFCSWTFRKAPKFFDVVTYTGTGTAGLTIDHNLGSVPGCIVVKSTDDTRDWAVYHRGVDATAPEDYAMVLQKTVAREDNVAWWNDTAPTSTQFTVGNKLDINRSGYNYVAYLFAHNDGDGNFGPTGDQDIIKCGSYTGDGGSGTTEVDLGFEPQWILVKASTGGDHWFIIDNMRGWATDNNTANDANLKANASNAESTGGFLDITSTGFKTTLYSNVNVSGRDYIYMAMRRGPMAVPESATDVFAIDEGTADFQSNFPVDMGLDTIYTFSQSWYLSTRLTGDKYLSTNSTNTEGDRGFDFFDSQDGYDVSTNWYGTSQTGCIGYMWRRAPNFFDVVCYDGDRSQSTLDTPHNLGVVPEMIWVKLRSGANVGWTVYHKDLGNTGGLYLNQNLADLGPVSWWGSTSPTATHFTQGASTNNYTGYPNIAYLFASLDGVSKVGSYTGTSASQTIDCGFSSGARFVLIKETSGAGNWYLFDTERGITSTSNDGVLQLNSTSAELAESAYGYDMLQPHNSGFTLTAAGNAVNFNGADFIFYAIA